MINAMPDKYQQIAFLYKTCAWCANGLKTNGWGEKIRWRANETTLGTAVSLRHHESHIHLKLAKRHDVNGFK